MDANALLTKELGFAVHFVGCVQSNPFLSIGAVRELKIPITSSGTLKVRRCYSRCNQHEAIFLEYVSKRSHHSYIIMGRFLVTKIIGKLLGTERSMCAQIMWKQ